MPARVPSHVKALRGTLRADRLNLREPQPKAGTPRPSRTLPPDVRREYDRLARRLAPMRVLSAADGLALELGALALAECWRLDGVLRGQGATYETTTPQGSTLVRQRPEVVLLADAWRRAASMLREFGLTPSSRGKVEVVPDPAPSIDPVEAFRLRYAKRRTDGCAG
jgi:P27 family predicted phage terminase small subunit